MSEALRQAAKEYLVRYGGDVFPNTFRSAKGTIVTDSDGREYLDFTSGQMCATIGHNHPAIVEAVNRAGQKAFHMFSGMIPEVVVELAETLAERLAAGRHQAHDLHQHRLGGERSRPSHGQDVHRRLRGAGARRLVARHHRRRELGLDGERPQGLRRAGAGRVRDSRAQRLSTLYSRA